MINPEHLHPIIVHFVIAPLWIAVVADFIWLFTKNTIFEKLSWYNFIVAGTCGVFSVITGLVAEENVVIPENSIELFNYHENLAFFLIIFLLILVFWRFALKGKIPVKFSYLYYLVSVICLLAVSFTAYQGGKLVFEHGISVKSQNFPNVKPNKLENNKPPKFQFLIPDTTRK